MNYAKDIHKLTADTTCCRPECKHKNGWYGTVYFFFNLFSRYYYCCSDCGKFIPAKEFDKVKEGSKDE